MRKIVFAAFFSCLISSGVNAQVGLSSADEMAAYRAAGFTRVGKQWENCQKSSSLSYIPGMIGDIADINGDGRPDVVLTENSVDCYGMASQNFWVVSKQADGKWKLITSKPGIPTFLPRAHAREWPDIEIGGVGFCYPVHRWNGHAYAFNRFQFEGRSCQNR